MTTDLKNIYDHPAVLLDAEAERLSLPEVHGGTITYPPVVREAAALLRSYEREHNVTFAALKNDTLERVREAYLRETRPTNPTGLTAQEYDDEWAVNYGHANDDLRLAVRDLLGLDD